MRIVTFASLCAFTCTLACEGLKDAPSSSMPPSSGQMPAGHPSVAANDSLPPAPPSGEVHGRIELDAKVADHVHAGDVIFVVARNGATNAVIAATRLVAPDKFPLSFVLNGENVMMPGASLIGHVKLSARVDKDGDAISKNPGDVAGEVTDLVEVSGSEVVIKLDRVL